MNKILLIVLLIVGSSIYFFLTFINDTDISKEMQTEAKRIAQSSKVFLSNKRYKELKFTEEERIYLLNKEKIRMCVDPQWMPFEEIKDSEHRGITADYIDIFRQLLGIPIELVVTSTWSESLEKAQTRECDIFSLVSKTKKREEYMDFTTPYITSPIVIATKIGIPFIEDLEQVIDKPIAIVKGYSLNSIIKKDYPALDIYEVDSLSEGLKEVERNNVFGYLDNATVINDAIQKDFLGHITISGKIKYSLDFRVATRNDEPLLNKIFQTMVSSIDEDTKTTILQKWIKIKYSVKTDYTLVYQILFVSLLIILGGIYSNRKLSLLNKELEKERDKANKLAETKSEFLANMSHEIRTPMHGIIGMSHLALNCELNSKSKNYIQKIDKSAKLLLSIINEILDFSKMEAGKLQIEKVEFNLNDMIQDVVNLNEPKLNEKGLELYIYNKIDTDKIYFGDSYRLMQILMNIMSNAIKFTDFGSITLLVKEKSNGKIEFSVRDTGIGLSINQIDKLFTPFIQGDGSITRKYGGTGLGLSISKQLVELLDGSIWVESKEKKGSVFIFEVPLPQSKESLDEIIDEKSFPSEKKVSRPKLKNNEILIVEDNPINQEILIGLLEDSGICTTSVYNGKEAVDEIQLNPQKYNLILMDMKMPIMSGLEASEIIRKYNKQVPIVVITANTLDSDKKKAFTLGVNDYLHKPIDVDKLYEVIYQYLSTYPSLKTTIPEPIIEDVLKKFEYIDAKIGLMRLNENKDLYLKILRDFRSTYKDVYFISVKEKDFALTIHTLKGLAGSIGANKLYNIVIDIEMSNDENLISDLNLYLHEVINELSLIKNCTKQKIVKKLISKSIKEAYFEELKKALEDNRPKKITIAIEKMDEYSFNSKDTEKLNEIKKNISMYKYKEALVLLDL